MPGGKREEQMFRDNLFFVSSSDFSGKKEKPERERIKKKYKKREEKNEIQLLGWCFGERENQTLKKIDRTRKSAIDFTRFSDLLAGERITEFIIQSNRFLIRIRNEDNLGDGLWW